MLCDAQPVVSVDRLDPLPAVVCGSTAVVVDRFRPVAVLRAADASVRVVTWPDAPLPARSASPSVLAAPGCAWVVYAEDSTDGSAERAATAVRIGLDGQVAFCELGTLEAIGADEHGVWLTPSPYPLLEETLGAVDEEAGADDAVDQGPPPGFDSAPVQAWEDFERAQREVSDAQTVGDVAQFLATASPEMGEGESFGWFAYAPGSEPPPSAPSPEPPEPSPTGAAVLHRVGVSGGHEQMVVSRVVSRVQAVGGGVLRLVFHPTGLVLTADPDGYGYGVHYPRRVVEVDASAALPAALDLDLDAMASQPFDEEEEGEEEPVVDEADRVDLANIVGTRWTPRPLGPEEVEAAVAAVRAQYAGLDEPHVVHTRRDDRWHRVQSEYADLEIRTEGMWPETEVVVDFTYRPQPAHRLRRRTRVFDAAGAPLVSPYLSVYLDEDLATTDLDQLPVRDGHRQI